MNEIAKKENGGLAELQSWGDFALKAGLVPAGTNCYQAMAIIQMGRELGIQPLQALKNICFINGRLTVGIVLQLAVASRDYEVSVQNRIDGPDFCEITLERKGKTITTKYTIEDAKQAGLYKTPDELKQLGMKRQAWNKYTADLLYCRAAGRNLKSTCPEVSAGLLTPEEAAGIEEFVPAEIESQSISLPSPEESEKDAAELAMHAPPDEERTAPEGDYATTTPDIAKRPEDVPISESNVPFADENLQEENFKKLTDEERKAKHLATQAQIRMIFARLKKKEMTYDNFKEKYFVSIYALPFSKVNDVIKWIDNPKKEG